MSSKPPIYQAGEPDDYDEILSAIAIELLRLNLTWYSDRVIRYVYALHAAAGWEPESHQQACLCLCQKQLEAIHKKLVWQRSPF